MLSSNVPDIEDLQPGVENGAGRGPKRHVVPAVRHTGKARTADSGGYLPGRQSVWVKTWGCGHNNSDGEYMAGQLAAYGYSIVANGVDADLWVLNSCTVKNPSEESLRNEVERAKKLGKRLVLAGCVPQADRSSYYDYSTIGVQQIDRIVEVVEETLKGNTVSLLKEKKDQDKKKLGGASLALPKIRKNALVEIIPISTGCLNQCTYCKTKHARGELGSYPVEEIVARVEQVLQEGVVEIWLTSEDTGAYGHDIGTSLPELVRAILPVMPDGTRLKIGMTNPPYILEHLPDMAEIFNHPRVYKFLHVPVQAGSDRVLGVMKREYTCADFRRVVDFLSAKVPGMTIATDVICGFPTESAEEFEETLELVREYQFKVVNISQFYARPGTPAKRMVQVKTDEKKRRSRLMTELFHSYEPYRGREGEVQRVLVTDISADGRYYVAHNQEYDQVLVPQDSALMGREVDVRIVRVSRFCMFGDPVSAPRQAAVALHTRRRTESAMPPRAIATLVLTLLAAVVIRWALRWYGAR